MRIAILTNFAEFNPGYSLTGIVLDQVEILTRAGHTVDVYVREGADVDGWRSTMKSSPDRAKVIDAVPAWTLRDYQHSAELTEEHMAQAKDMAKKLEENAGMYDVIFTHDWIFTGWNLPYAQAVKLASNKKSAWLHWVHSIPTGRRDWWDIREYGPGHRLVYPNESDRLRAAEQYRAGLADVLVIPHIKDPRTWFDFAPETRRFIDRHPAVLSADIVQVLPASSDRLTGKRLDTVIRLFGCFKRRGYSVCLIAANQWATGRQARENLEQYDQAARDCGLIPGIDFVFTSRADEAWRTGAPRRVLRELFQLSNLFVFPTREETFGLVVPEAAAAGCLLVGNKSLDQQVEIAGGPASGLFFEFGSYEREVRREDQQAWLAAAAAVIAGEMARDRAVRFKTYCRRKYNRSAIFRDYYQPVLAARRAEAA